MAGIATDADRPASAILDTNAWLDLFVFQDERARPLAQALHGGRVRALRSARTDAELLAVLQRPEFVRRCDEAARAALLHAWRSLAGDADALPLQPAPWICRDPDDQKFLDLACASGATWLFTKDRALLELAPRARATGLRIALPQDYAVLGP